MEVVGVFDKAFRDKEGVFHASMERHITHSCDILSKLFVKEFRILRRISTDISLFRDSLEGQSSSCVIDANVVRSCF